MSISPLSVMTQVALQVTDGANPCGAIVAFDSKLIKTCNGSNFLQEFDDIITIPAATVQLQISTETVTNIQVLFMMSDQQVQVYLVPLGSLLSQVQPITLAGTVNGVTPPSLLSVYNIIAIYVSNPTSSPAKFTVCGAGT